MRRESLQITCHAGARLFSRFYDRQRQTLAVVVRRSGKSFPLAVPALRVSLAPSRLPLLGTLVARCLHRRCVGTKETTMDSILGVHESALLFRAKRMEVLA
ncbi:MAG: hypothetical protein ABW061_02980, partial [Polyangiaceae bacterium]